MLTRSSERVFKPIRYTGFIFQRTQWTVTTLFLQLGHYYCTYAPCLTYLQQQHSQAHTHTHNDNVAVRDFLHVSHLDVYLTGSDEEYFATFPKLCLFIFKCRLNLRQHLKKHMFRNIQNAHSVFNALLNVLAEIISTLSIITADGFVTWNKKKRGNMEQK